MVTEEQILQYENAIKQASLQAEQNKMNTIQMEMDRASEDKSIIKEQLDLSQEKTELYYQLRGYILKTDKNSGELVWTPDPNNDLSFLTEAGINYCFWFLLGYLNKNILLGNYDDEQISAKMEDIGVTLNDTLFTKSNKYFREPTLEDCKDDIKKRIRKKIDLRKFAAELIGSEISEEELEKEIIKEMEGTIENEMEKSKVKLMNERYKMLNSLILWMLDQIHGAYQRAWQGQERRSLRQHMHISETKGGQMLQPQKQNESIFDKIRRR